MPLEQISSALKFLAFYCAAGIGKTGLTVAVDVFKNDTLIVTAASATEIGDGLYRYTLASGSVDAEGEYIAVFKTADATVDGQHIVSSWTVQKAGVENLDATISTRLATAGYTTPPTAAAITNAVWDASAAAHDTAGSTGAKLNLITSVSVTITDPVAQNGDVSIRQGKDYTLTWALADPPLAATTLSFQCLALGFTKTATFATPNISVTLTSAETALFGQGVYPFEIEATVSATTVVLVDGELTVNKDR